MNDATPDCICQPAFPGQREPYYQKRSAWLHTNIVAFCPHAAVASCRQVCERRDGPDKMTSVLERARVIASESVKRLYHSCIDLIIVRRGGAEHEGDSVVVAGCSYSRL
jgi:hypothetical protein